MSKVSVKLAALEAEKTAIEARLAGTDGYLEEFEAGSSKTKFILSDGQRKRDEDRLHYVDSQISQLSTVFGSRSVSIKAEV